MGISPGLNEAILKEEMLPAIFLQNQTALGSPGGLTGQQEEGKSRRKIIKIKVQCRRHALARPPGSPFL